MYSNLCKQRNRFLRYLISFSTHFCPKNLWRCHCYWLLKRWLTINASILRDANNKIPKCLHIYKILKWMQLNDLSDNCRMDFNNNIMFSSQKRQVDEFFKFLTHFPTRSKHSKLCCRSFNDSRFQQKMERKTTQIEVSRMLRK